MIVKVSTPGAAVQFVDLTDSQTVADALSAASMSVGDRDIKVDGEPAELDTVVTADCHIQLVRKVKGA